MAAGGALIAVGALALLALGKKGGSKGPVCPQGTTLDPASGRCVAVGPVQPNTPQTQTSGANPTAAVSTALTLSTGLATTVAKLVASGSATGGATATATTSSAAAAAGSATAGFFSAGPLYLAAAIIVAVVATVVIQGITANIQTKHYWEEKVLTENTNPVLFAEMLFKKFTEKATRRISRVDGQPCPDGWSEASCFYVINLSPAQLRQVGLACLYIASFVPKGKNDGLVAYYNFMGWTPAQMANSPVVQNLPAGNAWPGRDFFRVGPPSSTGYWSNSDGSLPSNALTWILKPLQLMFAAVRPANVSGNPVWDATTRPFTTEEMRIAATQVFGADLPSLEKSLYFMGKSKAVFLAAVEGYGSEGGGWAAWLETLGRIFNWTPVGHNTPQKVVYWVTNASPPYPLETWWLVDPVTGNRMAPLETHSDNVMRVSIKGAPIMPGVPNSPLAGFGDGEGIRYNPDGTTSLVSSLDPVYMEQQARAVKPFVLPVAASAEFAKNIRQPTSSLLLPVLGLGAAAAFLLRRKS